MGRVHLRGYQKAFALPTVLITSIVMLTVLLSALTAASSVSAGLKNQYLNQLSRMAAQSGATMAKTCMEANNGTITWSSSKPLKPNTDCTGTESISCPITATSATCYVLKAGNYRTTFKVKVITDDDDNPTDISVEGLVREVRKTSGEVVRQNSSSLKMKVDSSPISTASQPSEMRLYSMMESSSNYTHGATANYGTPLGYSTSFDYSGHSCAIMDSQLYCWGRNAVGQLGDGTTTDRAVPTLVSALAGKEVTTIRTTSYPLGSVSGFSQPTVYRYGSTCAIADSQLYCWGMKGSGGATAYSATPQAFSQLSGKTVTDISMSESSGSYLQVGGSGNGSLDYSGHACAIADSQLYCWGRNAVGQLGDGTATDRAAPTLVSALAGKKVTAVQTTAYALGSASGYNQPTVYRYGSTCAIADSQLYCWGMKGSGGATAYSATPQTFSQLNGKTVTDVSMSEASTSYSSSSSSLDYSGHACAIADSQLYCWGRNAVGQLGDGTATDRAAPTLVSALAGKKVTAVQTTAYALGSASGYNQPTVYRYGSTCAIADGQLYCWGAKGGGGVVASSTTPQAFSQLSSKTVTGIYLSEATGSFISGSGTTTTSVDYSGHACAIADSQLYCWGRNAVGQLGDGTSTDRAAPTLVSALAGKEVTAVKTTAYVLGSISGYNQPTVYRYGSTCAIADDQLYCWGVKGGGGVLASSATPQAFSQFSGKTAGAPFVEPSPSSSQLMY